MSRLLYFLCWFVFGFLLACVITLGATVGTAFVCFRTWLECLYGIVDES